MSNYEVFPLRNSIFLVLLFDIRLVSKLQLGNEEKNTHSFSRITKTSPVFIFDRYVLWLNQDDFAVFPRHHGITCLFML